MSLVTEYGQKRPILVIDGKPVRLRGDGLDLAQDIEVDPFEPISPEGFTSWREVPGSQRVCFVDGANRRRVVYFRDAQQGISKGGREVFCITTSAAI